MFGLFKKQRVTVVLPLTLDFFSVRDCNGRSTYESVPHAHQVLYEEPVIKLAPRARKMFEICDCSIDLRFDHLNKCSVRHVVEFSERLWDSLSIPEKEEELQRSVLRSRQPFLLVPANKLVDIERAIEHLKNELESERQDSDV